MSQRIAHARIVDRSQTRPRSPDRAAQGWWPTFFRRSARTSVSLWPPCWLQQKTKNPSSTGWFMPGCWGASWVKRDPKRSYIRFEKTDRFL